jgi:hypothetical protein
MKMENLFQEINLEMPSEQFTGNLMLRIEKEFQKSQRKKNWLTIGQIAAGVIGMIVIPALALYLCAGYSFPAIKLNLHIDPIVIIIGISVLLLLIGDTLFRKHYPFY